MLQFLVSLILSLNVFAQSPNPTAENKIESKNRVEDLLIWKISEDLKLSVKEEKDLSEVIKTLSAKKNALNSKVEELISKMSKAAKNEKSAYLAEYKKQIRAVNNISIEEFDKVQKILGSEKTAQYLVVKSEVASRIRLLLGSQERPEAASRAEKSEPKAMSEPKVIEE